MEEKDLDKDSPNGSEAKSKSAKKRNRLKKGPVEVIDADKAAELNLEDGDGQGSRSFSIQDIRKAMEVLSFQQKPAKTTEEALQKQYKFWSTQPVPKMGNWN